MKRIYISKLVLLTAILLTTCLGAFAQPVTFSYTGSVQYYTVPTGITAVTIDMAGARGGGSEYNNGGAGGRLQCVYAVTGGQVLNLYVGSVGSGTGNDGGSYGNNGAGYVGGNGSSFGGGGGGCSEIQYGGSRILVAGAGGGGSWDCTSDHGGLGGNATGGNGLVCGSYNSSYCGTGGTQAGGGTAGSSGGASNGSYGSGGNGGGGTGWESGGGCGYYGGGGGSNYGSGGGGSSYPISNGGNVSNLSLTQGYNNSGSGYITISTPAPVGFASFSYTGGLQTYSVPSGITSITVTSYGAAGGLGYGGYSNGGCGGKVVCSLAVTPGTILNVYVGGMGTQNGCCGTVSGGSNGGASTGGSGYYFGSGGGACTQIEIPPYNHTTSRVIVAGGGGGAGYYCASNEDQGGAGGNATGGNGEYCNAFYSGYSGQGGTSAAGGAGASSGGQTGNTNGPGDGGNSSTYYYGGGGGGGYNGGGGSYIGGGGGGSSYASATLCTSIVMTQGNNCNANGQVTIAPNCTAGSITGTPSTCVGFTTTLADVVAGGGWVSSNTAVATVAGGVVTGVSAGTALISYGGVLACGTVWASVTVTVTNPPSAITGPSTACQTQTATLTSSAVGTSWTSSNTAVATVTTGSTTTGVVSGISAGSATISYLVSATCYVTYPVTVLVTAPVTGVSSVCQGLTTTLSEATGGGTWSSSNTAVGTVDPSLGIVGGISAAGVTISYTQTNGCVMTDAVTVNPLPAAIGGNLAVCNGLTTALTDAGGTWSSGTTSVATIVAGTGVATGVSPGTTIITYTYPTSCINTATLLVNPLPLAISGSQVCAGLTTLLTDATPAGTWTSSTPTLATVGSSTGIVTGISAGVVNMTYTITATGCIMTAPFTVNPLPLPITGSASPICVNATTYLADAVGGGLALYSSSNPSVATIVPLTGLVTGVGAGSSIITYTLPTGCIMTTTETVLLSPAPITGTTTVCANSTTTLVSSPLGGQWASSNTYQATVGISSGIVSGVSPGNPVVTYTLPNNCWVTTNTTVNASPDNISGLSSVCLSSTITLGDITPGGVWTSSSPVTAPIGSATGVVTGVSVSAPVITYKLPATGCYVTTPITINPLPGAATVGVTGGGSYCIGGTGQHITLSTSALGISYNLYNGSTLIGSLTGNNSSLDYGAFTAVGVYTVQAVNATTGCARNMTGSATISVNPLPTQYGLYTAGGVTGFCVGNTVDVFMDTTDAGVLYTLYYNSMPTTTVLLGTGTTLDFGVQSAGGVYSVYATNTSSGCNNSMLNSISLTQNALPEIHNVTGGGSYCPYATGVHVGLDFSDPGVNYQLYNGTVTIGPLVSGSSSAIDFGDQTAGAYSIIATNAVTGCQNTMNGSAAVVAYTLPFVYSVGGGGSYCSGTGGAPITLSTSDFGINYQLYNGTTAVGAPYSGDGTVPTMLGNETLPGSYTVVATDATTGCIINMAGSTNVSVNPLPTAYSVTGSGSFCAGGTGVSFGLPNSQSTVSYQAFKDGLPVGMAVTGTGSSIVLGTVTDTGVYTVVGTDNITNCVNNMTGGATVSVNALPTIENVTGGGSYCAGGSGLHVGLDFSSTGVTYQLYLGGVALGHPVIGSNSGLDFGLQATAGTYTVKATNVVTTCSSVMNDSAMVNINPTPTVYTVTGSRSSYCIGDSGIHITLVGSDMGISYQLYNLGLPVGSPLTGSGALMDFGLVLNAGTYSIVGNNLASGCSSDMYGTPTLRINPLPAVYTVTGGGQFCNGGTGVHIGLNNSAGGVTYQLYNGGMPTGTPVSGTGGSIDFGLQTAAGTYTAIATNVSTTCANAMTGSGTVVVYPNPAPYSVTGGGAFCTGSAAPSVSLANSASGISYMLYRGTTLVGTMAGSTGSSLNFGTQATPGVYTISASDVVTGCSAAMTGSTTVVENSLPPVYTMYGGGYYCAGGTGVHVNLSGSTMGINYQLYYNGTATGASMVATGAALDFGSQRLPGTYTVIGTNPGTTCFSNMAGVSTVAINPNPVVYAVTGGGSYCSGGNGVSVGVSNSDNGIEYQLFHNGVATGSPMSGSGLSLNYGLQTAAGTYTVNGRNSVTGCLSDMTGSTSVSITPITVPSVSIATGSTSVICGGSVVNFTAVPVNGGSSPMYSWSVNGINRGTGNVYSYAPGNGDEVTAVLTSDAACVMPATASNTIVMNVIPYETPAVSISATPGNKVCNGSSATFTATPLYGGTSPVYSWLVNNSPVATGTSYSYVPANGDVVMFGLTSNYPCVTAGTVYSNTELMQVQSPAAPTVSVSVNGGTNIAHGQLVTLTATISGAGPNPLIQWTLNGAAIPGANSATLVTSNLNNNDNVTCVVIAQDACGDVTAYNSVIFTVVAEGVNNLNASGNGLSVLPNPNNGSFKISGSLGGGVDESVTFEVTNMLGQVVYTGEFTAQNGVVNKQINLESGIANGMYLLNIHSGTGTNVFHIVVEK